MQLCLAQAFAAALFRGLQRALEALAIYATSRAEFGTGDVLAYTKALGSEAPTQDSKSDVAVRASASYRCDEVVTRLFGDTRSRSPLRHTTPHLRRSSLSVSGATREE